MKPVPVGMIRVYNEGKYSSAAYCGCAWRGKSFFTKFHRLIEVLKAIAGLQRLPLLVGPD